MDRNASVMGFCLLLIAITACGTATASTPTPMSPTPTPVIPIIQSFLPGDSAPAGAIISIIGENFGDGSGDAVVEFGHHLGGVSNWSSTSIQARLPLDLPPGQTQVSVTVDGQRSAPRPLTVLVPTLASIGLRSVNPDFAYRAIAADFDNDGDLDMFHPVNFAESGVDNAYYLNNGDGTFAQQDLSAVGLPVNADTYHAVAADFDQDGDADLYAVGSREAFYALNNGDGTFALQNLKETGLQMRTDQIECFTVVATDFDRDGDLDLYANCGILVEGGVDDFYALNNGDGTFTPQDLAASGVPAKGDAKMLTTADLNGDGAPDLWVGHLAVDAFYLLNNGDGTFSRQDLVAAGLSGVGIGSLAVIADFDGDGDVDIFIQDAEPSTDFVASRFYALNNGDGTFVLQDLAAVGLEDLPQKFNWVTSADFNGDGHPDLLSSDPFEPGGFYALNNGDGTFALQDRTAAGLPTDFTSQEPGVADFDQDGDLDVFLTNAYALNKGDGMFIMLR